DPRVLVRGPDDLDVVTRKPCLETKRASRPALARKTVTHRDTRRLTFDDELQLAATAGGLTRGHGESLRARLVGARSGQADAAGGKPQTAVVGGDDIAGVERMG